MGLGGDVRYGFRQLVQNPAFSVLSVLTLALGIGGTVALFSVVHSLMIRPLPITDEDRVVAFWMDYNWRGEEFDHVRELPEQFEEIAAFSNNAYTLRSDDGGTTLVLATVASTELWRVLGTPPLLGRTFLQGEDRPGSEAVVVLGHAIWERDFGSDPGVVGSRINLDGVPTTVVGVMPEGFYFPSPEMEIFVPLELDPDREDYAGNGWLVLAGRLLPDATPPGLEEDLTTITRALGERYDYPAIWDKTRDPYFMPIREYLLGDVRPAMLVLLAAVGLLLVMACVNVAALIVTRTVDRTREMSIRTALGAGRLRLARQVLTESVVLGLVSGSVGLVLAVACFDILVASLPIDGAFRQTLAMDWPSLAATTVLAMVVGCLIALVPMKSLLRGRPLDGALTTRSDGGLARSGTLQGTLVVAEVLLAVVLVTGASLLVRTVDQLRAIDPGLNPEGVLAMDLIVSSDASTDAERALFFEQMIERVSTLPGVSSAGLTNRLPLRDGGFQGTVTIADRPDLDGTYRPNAMYRVVSPGVFEALEVDILRGRGIDETDVADGRPVAVINETFARRIWGGEDPIGRSYRNSLIGSVEIVGVVRDMAVTDLVGEQPMTGYYAWHQAASDATIGVLLAKRSGDPSTLVAPVRAIVRELEPRAAIGRVETMEETLAGAMSEPLRLRLLLGLFSVLGIVLGTVGVYGVVSYSVRRRNAEFGIRMALGAEPRFLLGEILREGMLPVVLGVAGGTLVALGASRALESFLFGVGPTDPWSMGWAAAVLMAAGLIAALGPAVRASNTNPAVALRAE